MARQFARHAECIVHVEAEPGRLFEHLDDPTRLGAHMSRGSPMMMGGSMSYELDAARGRAVGSVIRMTGRIMGVELALEETVTVHDPPARKEWRTVGEPRLVVIGAYRMGFDVGAEAGGSRLRVYIDYSLPGRGPTKLLSLSLGPVYARWCVERMARDAARHFAIRSVPS
jgi:hypothetical protein